MAQTIGYDTVEESVSEGGSLSSPVTVDAQSADTLYVYVDDGSGNAVAESYTLTVEVEKGVPHDSTQARDWFEETNLAASTSTAKRHSGEISGGVRLRVDLTNESDTGTSQNYRIVVHARAEGAA